MNKLTTKRLHRHKLQSGVLGLALHPDNGMAYAACIDGVYELDVESGESRRLYEHQSYASNVVYIHERNQIVSSGYDGALQWYDLDTDSVIRHIQAHQFWSWDLARAPEAPIIASSTGQYLAGDYEYRPRPSDEPCVRVYHAITGELLSSHVHGPPAQCVGLDPSGTHVAAGNLMGDVGVWRVGEDNGEVARWNTPDFTAFGIIKSHCQIGGLYAIAFAPDAKELIVAGMGPMRDPMAGNGKQRWQRFAWTGDKPVKVSQSNDGQVGEGLMETLAVHPGGQHFVMAGRLRGGSWSAGLFD
ncbi:MAG: hypothetical protein AAF497_11065, partial [Planctomycetota bacterium]